jgi:hypothetical protein
LIQGPLEAPRCDKLMKVLAREYTGDADALSAYTTGTLTLTTH